MTEPCCDIESLRNEVPQLIPRYHLQGHLRIALQQFVSPRREHCCCEERIDVDAQATAHHGVTRRPSA
jgi:hypothetical protein